MATQQRERQGNSKPATPAGPKTLRIGIILGDRIVEERLIRNREQLTIGQSAKNSFSVPTPELPKHWTLFQVVAGRYVLCASEGMDGRISDGGQVQTLAQIRQGGKAKRQGGAWLVPLSDDARGKIVVGDMTMLFQFVTAPPPRPKPQLPHSVRGSLADQIDPYLAVVLLVSLLFHTGGYSYFKYFRDEPRALAPDEVPPEYLPATIEKIPAPVVTTTTGPGEDEVKPGDDEVKGPDEPAKGSAEDEPAGGPDKAVIAQRVQNTAVLRVLGGAGSSGSGAYLDVSGGRDIEGSLEAGLNNLGSSGGTLAAVGPGGGLADGSRGTATGAIASGTQTTVTGPKGPANTGPGPSETDVKVTGSTEDISGDESGELNPDVFEQAIKSRYNSRALKCYQNAAKVNPTLRGKVEVGITVGPAGTVVKVAVKGFDAGVDACIKAEAYKWRFPKPEEQVTFEFSFVFRPA